MDLPLLVVPYDSGLRGWRMGAGPARLLEAGVAEDLRAVGHRVSIEWIEADAALAPAEIRTAFELNRTLAERTRAARQRGALPVILAGNCFTGLGTLAGLSPDSLTVLWFDAHGDLHTPETTQSGFLDGMALAAVSGRCWGQLGRSVPGFVPVPERRVLLLGTRDLDAAEEALLEESEITWLAPEQVRHGLAPVLEELRGGTGGAYVHLDLDVLDPEEGYANGFAAPAGLRVSEVQAVLERVARTLEVQAVALTAYDPSWDAEGRICGAASALLKGLLGGAFVHPGLTRR